VVRDQINGRLLPREDLEEFVAALTWVASLGHEERKRSHEEARNTARAFSMARSARLTLAVYYPLIGRKLNDKAAATGRLSLARRRIAAEWEILNNMAHAVGDAVLHL
jgi:hypothetical protein